MFKTKILAASNLPTLEEFIKSPYPKNSYVKYKTIDSYYRKGPVVIDGQRYSNVLTRANTTNKKRSRNVLFNENIKSTGLYRELDNLTMELAEKYGFDGVYIEGVLNEFLGKKLLEYGYKKVNDQHGADNYFKPTTNKGTEVKANNFEGNVQRISELEGVKYDQEHGLGQVPDNQNVKYLGFAVQMSADQFLKLAANRDFNKSSSVEHIIEHIKNGGAIGSPFLSIDMHKPIPEVKNHEGRTRVEAISRLYGKTTKVLVHVFLYGGDRAHHITLNDIVRAHDTMMGELIQIPYKYNFSGKVFFQGKWQYINKEAAIETKASLGVVYHSTGLWNLYDILDTGKIRLSTSLGSASDKATNDYPYFLSLTRSKIGGYHTRAIGNYQAIIALDYDSLRANNKITPRDYWGPEFRKTNQKINEMEETLVSKNQFIELPDPATKLIKGLFILYKPTNDFKEKAYKLRNTLLLAKRKGIPIYVYDNEKNWLSQRPEKAIPIKDLLDRLKGVEESNINWPRRNYFDRYLNIYYAPTLNHLSKDAKALLYKLSDYYVDEAVRSLEADLHNARSNKIAGPIVKLISKHGGTRKFIEYLAHKFDKEKVESSEVGEPLLLLKMWFDGAGSRFDSNDISILKNTLGKPSEKFSILYRAVKTPYLSNYGNKLNSWTPDRNIADRIGKESFKDYTILEAKNVPADSIIFTHDLVKKWLNGLDTNKLSDSERLVYRSLKDLVERYSWQKEVVAEGKLTHEKVESAAAERNYLSVPFAEKDKAKAAGAKWDSEAKKWYYPKKNLPKELEKYSSKEGGANTTKSNPIVVKREEIGDDGSYTVRITHYGREYVAEYVKGKINVYVVSPQRMGRPGWQDRYGWQDKNSLKVVRDWVASRIAALPKKWHKAHADLYPETEISANNAIESASTILYRGESVIQDAPKEHSHEGGVFFYALKDKTKAKNYSRSIFTGEKGALREIEIPNHIMKQLADLANDEIYNKLLPNEDDRSSKFTRGVMPSKELIKALEEQGYTGFRWRHPDKSSTEYFVLSNHLKGLKYKPLPKEKDNKKEILGLLKKNKIESSQNSRYEYEGYWINPDNGELLDVGFHNHADFAHDYINKNEKLKKDFLSKYKDYPGQATIYLIQLGWIRYNRMESECKIMFGKDAITPVAAHNLIEHLDSLKDIEKYLIVIVENFSVDNIDNRSYKFNESNYKIMLRIINKNAKAKHMVVESAVRLNSKTFQKWFRGSKIVDKNGNPLLVYHGTSIPKFKRFKEPTSDIAMDGWWYGKGFYFTPSLETADMYSKRTTIYKDQDRKPRVEGFYLKIKNPYIIEVKLPGGRLFRALKEDFGQEIIDYMESNPEFKKQNSNPLSFAPYIGADFLKKKGYDGVIAYGNSVIDKSVKNSTEIVAFYPTQIISAGDIDPDVVQKDYNKRHHGWDDPDSESEETKSSLIKANVIPCGDCFNYAFLDHITRKPSTLVHAIVQHPHSGKKFYHAWTEDDNKVYDWQTMKLGMSKYAGQGWPKDEFYSVYKPTDIKKYPGSVGNFRSKFKHTGPWENQEETKASERIIAANWMYHGSPADFENFKTNYSDFIIDRAIGVHFAADDVISKKFMTGLYDWHNKNKSGGFLYRVRAPSRSKVIRIHQKVYPSGTRASDQAVIGPFVANVVFSKYKILFIRWIKRARQIDDAMANEIYELLKAGKSASDPKFGTAKSKDTSIRSYIANFDSGLIMLGQEGKTKLAKLFNNIMKKRGIDALLYENTSPSEIRDDKGNKIARSTKSYILLSHALSKYKPEKVKAEEIKTEVSEEKVESAVERLFIYNDLMPIVTKGKVNGASKEANTKKGKISGLVTKQRSTLPKSHSQTKVNSA
jgi:hypothetical protein